MRILIFCLLISASCFSQNLVVNPGAENLPLGTGWTIVSFGPSTCATAPPNTFNSWTMVPDGSANYPLAHGGSRTFFSGCNASNPGGPYELYQDIDISANASLIDAGNLSTVFSGFIQTPIAPQADAGRFIIDFLTASSTTPIGVSYTTAYQSNQAGSGTGWVSYTNTRIAPIGSRRVRIRLQTMIYTSPAINAYFDDISFSVGSILPVKLKSFSGKINAISNTLYWATAEQKNTRQFIVERSSDGSNWQDIGNVAAVGNNTNTELNYTYHDESPAELSYYRLRMEDFDARYGHSEIVKLKRTTTDAFELKVYPNPVSSQLNLSFPTAQTRDLEILDVRGRVILQKNLSSHIHYAIDLGAIPAGIYFIQVKDTNGRMVSRKFSKK